MEWTGEVDISIISQADNPSMTRIYTAYALLKMMCANNSAHGTRDALRNLVHTYVMEVVDNDYEDVVEEDDEVIITKEDGNIVHLSFGSRTKGNA